jgi:hypothetical protein
MKTIFSLQYGSVAFESTAMVLSGSDFYAWNMPRRQTFAGLPLASVATPYAVGNNPHHRQLFSTKAKVSRVRLS